MILDTVTFEWLWFLIGSSKVKFVVTLCHFNLAVKIFHLSLMRASQKNAHLCREIKKDFIQKKYVQKKFYHPSGHSPDVLLEV